MKKRLDTPEEVLAEIERLFTVIESSGKYPKHTLMMIRTYPLWVEAARHLALRGVLEKLKEDYDVD